MRRTLLATAAPDWRPLHIAAYVYPLVAIHDVWFYAVHWAMHRRALYKRVHFQHHVHEGDLTVFGARRPRCSSGRTNLSGPQPAPAAAPPPAGLLAPPRPAQLLLRPGRASAARHARPIRRDGRHPYLGIPDTP